MPLDNAVIEEAFQRYRREYDCYEKLARLVANKCEREIIRANTIRAAVTFRAKGPHKLLGKLQIKYRAEPLLNTADDALRRVTDLAGVRISTYLEGDRARVVEEIVKLFDGPGGAPVEVDVKDAPGKFYRATHCQVGIKRDDLTEENDNVEGLLCEIQVCSLLAHVWNELEHDLVYKPMTGKLSTREKESLELLGGNMASGDLIIKQLFDANEDRIKQSQDESSTFSDVYDFVARMRGAFPECDKFGDNAGQLFENLVSLGFDTPTKVRDQLLIEDYQARSQTLLNQLQQHLSGKNDDTVSVEPESSDALLVLLLDSHLDSVFANNPMGRGKGRPPRIASFAYRFLITHKAPRPLRPALGRAYTRRRH
jgi:ppGpp synthetase/RelA/SpoT-type nucleotidyltranferase